MVRIVAASTFTGTRAWENGVPCHTTRPPFSFQQNSCLPHDRRTRHLPNAHFVALTCVPNTPTSSAAGAGGATVAVIDDLVVTRSVRVPRRELRVTFTTSGGPGGQHANKTASRVELRLDLLTSSAFGPDQRARVVARLGPQLRIVVDDERSQLRNRAIAEDRLIAALQAALHIERQRRETRPTKGSQVRRVEAKQRRGETKQQRQKPRADD